MFRDVLLMHYLSGTPGIFDVSYDYLGDRCHKVPLFIISMSMTLLYVLSVT